jgi:NADPH-dependent 2,4-dienoyl-CoA reductase/sulfur reductase-like enzyme
MNKAVVIVGASIGGLRTAEALRRFGYAGAITAIGDEVHAPYNRPPLSKEVLQADTISHESVAFPMRPATADVSWVLGRKVVGVNLEHDTVTCDDDSVYEYSHLVIATGLRPKRKTYPNNLQVGRHVIRTLDDALALRAQLEPGKRVVVLGAGFVGCETAATARKLGCDVTVVSPGSLPLNRPLGEELAGELKRRQESQGVKFVLKRNVEDLIGESPITAIKLDDSTELDCDVFIEAIGSLPNTDFLESTELDISDGLLCDENLNAVTKGGKSVTNVWAVGDVARFPNATFDNVARRVEHWNIPSECAKHVGQAIASVISDTGETETKAFRPVPSFWSDQFDVHILAFGLPSLADRATLVQGQLDGDFVFEYHRGNDLVGVAGIGMRSVVQGYRKLFEGEEKP